MKIPRADVLSGYNITAFFFFFVGVEMSFAIKNYFWNIIAGVNDKFDVSMGLRETASRDTFEKRVNQKSRKRQLKFYGASDVSSILTIGVSSKRRAFRNSNVKLKKIF